MIHVSCKFEAISSEIFAVIYCFVALKFCIASIVKMETENQSYIPGSNAECVTSDISKGFLKEISTHGVEKNTPFKGNEVPVNYIAKLLDGTKLATNVDPEELFVHHLEKNSINKALDVAVMKRGEECISYSSTCGKVNFPNIPENATLVFENQSCQRQNKDICPNNNKSALGSVLAEDEGYTTSDNFVPLEGTEKVSGNGIDNRCEKYAPSSSGYNYAITKSDILRAERINAAILKYLGDTDEDFSEEDCQKYRIKHVEARKLYEATDPSKGSLRYVVRKIRDAPNNTRLIKLMKGFGAKFGNEKPTTVIALLEAIYEAGDQEQEFIESHKKDLRVNPDEGLSKDHLFYAALSGVIITARRYRLTDTLALLHQYYGVEVLPYDDDDDDY